MSFYVVGLPRSRTAWLSVFLTHDGNFCHHEGFQGCSSVEEYKTKLGNDGDSGTALMLLDKLDGPTVVIERAIEPILLFCENTYNIDFYETLLKLKSKMDKVDGLRIHYEDIDDRLEEIWLHLIGTPYDSRRGEALKKLQIQVADPFGLDVRPELARELGYGNSLQQNN